MKAIRKEFLEEWGIGEQTIDEVIDDLKKLRKQYQEKGFFDLHFVEGSSYDYSSFYLHGSRIETDEEYDKRVEAERKREVAKAKRAADQREKDLARYEKLKKKLKL